MSYRMNVAILVGLSLSIVARLAAAGPIESEPKLTVLASQVAVGVTPQIAPPGTPRKIVVAGLWPNGCVPVDAELSEAAGYGKPTLVVTLTEPLTFAACTAALTHYRFEIDYTPRAAGQLDIVAITTLAKAVGKGTLVTGDASDPRAIHDVAGAWYDPQTSGSGLMIAHDYGQSDAVFATWAVYEPASGAPRWFSLQQGQWQADGLAWKGFAYETKADPRSDPTPCALCPTPLSHVVFHGLVRLTFAVSFVHGGLDATLDLLPAGAPPQRLANLRRFVPHRIVIQ